MFGAELSCNGRTLLLGVDEAVSVDYQCLASACGRPISHLEADLLWVAGYVACADRTFRRFSLGAPKRTWQRRIRLRLAVREPELWNAPSTKTALVDCLNYVTGDDWSFTFVKGGLQINQLPLDLGPSFVPEAVIPYSGGLDGFLLREDLKRQTLPALFVTTRVGKGKGRQAGNSRLDAMSHEIGLPIRLRRPEHSEPTYRTRTFMFASAAAVAASLNGCSTIMIGENGQGSLGASIVPFGDEVPFRTTHPIFTSKLRKFLTAIGIELRFEHPYLWDTKGQVLSRMLAGGMGPEWGVSRSCSRNMARTKKVSAGTACGICGNCLLRRMSVHSAQAQDSMRYYWSLVGSSLHESLLAKPKVDISKTDFALASHSVVSMDSFAKLSDLEPAFRRAVHEMAEHLGLESGVVAQRLGGLRERHASEWSDLLSALPKESWVRSFAGVE